jgi:hypothetical protein
MKASKLGTLNSTNGGLSHMLFNNTGSTADFNFFIYDLFNDRSSDYIVSNGRVIVINELVRMWKEMAMAFVRRNWEKLHHHIISTSKPVTQFPSHYEYYTTTNII